MLRQRFNIVMAIAGIMLSLASCSGCYKIDGVIETFGYEGRVMYLTEFLPSRTTKFDSCRVNHDKFQMRGVTDTTRLVFLCQGDRPIIPVYMEKGHTNITILPAEMTVSGTRQNDLFYTFLKKKIDIDNRYEDMSQKRVSISRSGFDSRRIELIQDTLRMIVDECEEMICSFMADNYKEPAAVGVFMMLSGASSNNDVTPLLRRILDAAPKEFLDKPFIKYYTHRINYARVDSID